MADKSRKKAKLIERSFSRVGSNGAKSSEADGEGSNTRPYQAGMIKHVSLVNFMNHANLELKLEPSVNILTGKNGAGKSSIIQAIVLGLGGSAKDTKRGDHLSDFIKREATKAEIRVHIDNSGEEAYRPEAYGNVIVLERIIYRAGSSINALKNESGRDLYKGAAATDEKGRIRKHFFIEIENPLTILQQEEAKIFFQDSTPISLYNQVMRATFLSWAQALYASANAEFSAISESIDRNKKLVEDKDVEFDKLSKMLALTEIDSDEEDRRQLNSEKLWYYALSQEEKLAAEKQTLPGAEQKVARLRDQLAQDQAEVEEQTRQLEREAMKLSGAQELTNCYGEERVKAKKRLEESKRAVAGINAELDDLKQRQKELRHEVQKTQQDIRAEKLKSESQKEGQAAQREAVEKAISQLNEDKSGFEKREFELRGSGSGLDSDLKSVGKDIGASMEEKRKLENDLRKFQRDLDSIDASSDLHRFGADVARLAEAVQRENCFRKRPIGPIGRHISLTGAATDSDNLRALVEAQLGRNLLRSFLVDNDEDFDQLQRLMNQHFRNKKKPDVYKCRFMGSRVDIRGGRVASTEDMPVVLDFLTFSNDEVFNHVVETKNVESILVVSDAQAQSLFENAASVPRNATQAISPTFYRYYPASDKQSYSSYYMDRPFGPSCLASDTQSFENNVKEHIAKTTKELGRLEEQVKALEAKRGKLNGDRRAIEGELERNERGLVKVLQALTVQQLRLSDLTSHDKRDIEALTKELKEFEALQEVVQQKMDQLFQERPRLNDNVKADQKHLKELEEKLESSKEQEQEPEELCSSLSSKIKGKKESMGKMRARLEKEEASLKRLEAEVADRQRKASVLRQKALELSNGREMETTRSIKEIAAFEKERERVREERLKSIGHSRAELEEQCKKVRSEVKALKKSVADSTKNFNMTQNMNKVRRSCFLEMRNRVTRDISRRFALTFAPYCGSMMGKLHFDHAEKTLRVEVSHLREDGDGTDATDSAPLPLASLSGGERSKTLCSLLLAVWEHVWTPFRCLDEWDVYLDAVVRPDIERMLYKHGKSSGQQYIFISPQGCSVKGANVIEIEKKTTTN